MRLLILLLLGFTSQIVAAQEIPYRPEANYELKLKYDFKSKNTTDKDVISFVEKADASMLPHLTIYISILNRNSGEGRIKIVDNKSNLRHNKKLSEDPVRLVMGYTDDMKNSETASKFIITISTKKRDAIDQIVLEVKKDGTFLVNEIVNGKL